jgi:hypothetical protein
MGNPLELILISKCNEMHLKLEKEYKFHDTRRWRFDYAIKHIYQNLNYIAFEYEGSFGRHNSFVGYAKDCEKYNMAQLMGWKVYRFTAYHFNKQNINDTLELIDSIFGGICGVRTYKIAKYQV